jgi:uncharacterized membrane protein YjgN (DUF898 family)
MGVVEEQSLRLRFTGRASEYFRIWIIGVALSLLTLGVYSAWAKVRSQQYLYRHTWLDGSSFQYLAEPRALVVGRLLLAALFILVFVVEVLYSPSALVGALALFVAMPWVVSRSAAFRARSSAFRNVRFGFVESLSQAYRIFLSSYAWVILTCGLGYPVSQRKRMGYVLDGLHYGSAPFRWAASRREYFSVYFGATVMALPMIILAAFHRHLDVAARGPARIVMYVLLLLPTVYLRTELANLTYGRLSIGPHRLRSEQRFWPLLSIYAVNTAAVLASLGLAIPWAKIRVHRYTLESLTLQVRGSLDTTSDPDAPLPGAYGDAAADLGGIDLGLG